MMARNPIARLPGRAPCGHPSGRSGAGSSQIRKVETMGGMGRRLPIYLAKSDTYESKWRRGCPHYNDL